MRVWEFTNNKEIPTDLVREQDFILRVRRMQRVGSPSLVLNFVLNAIEPLAKDHDAMQVVQKKLEAFAQSTNGGCYDMSNGDVFLAWEQPGDARITAMRAIEVALPEYAAMESQFLLTYRMPDNYAVLRERTNHYVDAVRAALAVGDGLQKVDSSQGKLTAKNVEQIEHLLGEIDLRRYSRTQHIYRDVGGKWQTLGEEYFISFDDLRRERFPKLEVVSSEHFFLALCGVLDQQLLTILSNNFDSSLGNRRINLNMSIASIMGSGAFTKFVHRVPREQRELIGFEIHRGDLFQDFELTLNAIDILKKEGFRVILDSITPDMVNYIDLAAFSVDAIKINVSKDRAFQLLNPPILMGLKHLPAEKLVFFRCDNERALAVGRELGVTRFQGWLIDDLAQKKS